jgi:hypothetical protein
MGRILKSRETEHLLTSPNHSSSMGHLTQIINLQALTRLVIHLTWLQDHNINNLLFGLANMDTQILFSL